MQWLVLRTAKLLLGVSQKKNQSFCDTLIFCFPGPEAGRIGRFTFRGTCPPVGTPMRYKTSNIPKRISDSRAGSPKRKPAYDRPKALVNKIQRCRQKR